MRLDELVGKSWDEIVDMKLRAMRLMAEDTHGSRVRAGCRGMAGLTAVEAQTIFPEDPSAH